MITRLAGGAGTAGATEAISGSGVGTFTGVGVVLTATGCSTVAIGAGGTSTAAGGGWGDRIAAVVAVETAVVADLVSCGAPFAGTATTGDAPVNPDEGGLTMTGPCGAREAIAGAGVGVAETICGACRGKGTIFRGAGFDPGAALADTVLTVVAPAGVPTDAGLTPEGTAAEVLAAGAGTVGFAAPAATAVTVGRGGAAVTPRCAPGDSRCSFCC
jgi:hypothetical protein